MERHLEKLRKEEVETVRSRFSPGKRVLEIGGGSGYQASVLASWGCNVVSIDLLNRPVPQTRFYPVLDYDGVNFPFANESFDIIFSSNVLEHIQPLPPIFTEMRRVLKAEGVALHLVPSSAWRLWTNISHYIYLLKRLSGRRHFIPGVATAPSTTETLKRNNLVYLLKRMLIAGPHGEYPTALSELYYFSKRRWQKVFDENGFETKHIIGNNLFYTGYGLLPGIPLKTRHTMARFMGSACHIYVTQKSVR